MLKIRRTRYNRYEVTDFRNRVYHHGSYDGCVRFRERTLNKYNNEGNKMLRIGNNSLGWFVEDMNSSYNESRYLCEDGVIRDWDYVRDSHHTVYHPTEAHAMVAVSDYEAKRDTLAMIAKEVMEVAKVPAVPNVVVVVHNPSMRLVIPKFKGVIMFIMA